jgi:hypothetical protein
MKPYLLLSLTISLALTTPAIPLRAANKPRAGKTEGATMVWTNDDLERLRAKSLISVVGQVPEKATEAAAAPSPYVTTQDREWYAEQASILRAELENREAELQRYRQAIEDARNLKKMTGGINFDRGGIGITPDASIEILQRRLRETQSEIDALENLARHNGIPPGTLRGE